MGALTDRFGGRLLFSLVSAATIVPVLYLGLAGHSSLTTLLVGGFFLGIGGTAFAVGVPLVNAWFPPDRRGLVVGVFGVGMGGTAISALTTVKLVDAHGMATPFLITAVVLAVYAVVAALLLRDAPGRTVPTAPLGRRLAATARLGITWQASALYAVTFGGYVAFSVYLPTYLKAGYGLAQADAANRMAGFVVLAVVMRSAAGSPTGSAPDGCWPAPWPWSRSGRWCRRSPRLWPRSAPSPSSPWPRARRPAAGRPSRWWPWCPRPTRSVRSPAWSVLRAASAASSRRW